MGAPAGTTATASAPSADVVVPAPPLQPIDRRIFLVAAAMFGGLMLFSARYGFDRDELYFLDCGRHLAGSYVDQPIFTPLVARLSLDLFGVSLVGLHLWSALAAFGTVVIGGLTAREFGGGRMAQLVGALGVATAPAVLASDHLFETTSFDVLAWAGLALVLARLGRTGDTRLFVPAGLVLGLGLSNKHSIAFFAVALVAGIILSRGQSLLRNRYFVIGIGVALLCTIPDLWWQATHHWPTIDMTRSLAQSNGGLKNVPGFVGSQLFMASPVLVPVWLAGLRYLWRSERPLWRAMAWSYGLLFVFFAATAGAKPYYVAGMYVFLIAAGAVAIEHSWVVDNRQTRRRFVLLGLVTVAVAPFVLPVLSASDLNALHNPNATPVESVGWPELVHTVASVWHGLPAGQRANAVIFTGNYGEAGAINELGRSDGLPEAVSGHNTLWFWGPGNPHATTVVAVVQARPAGGVQRYLSLLRSDFAHIRPVATLDNGHGVTDQEQGGHVYLLTGPFRSWARIWPSLRHYD